MHYKKNIYMQIEIVNFDKILPIQNRLNIDFVDYFLFTLIWYVFNLFFNHNRLFSPINAEN